MNKITRNICSVIGIIILGILAAFIIIRLVKDVNYEKTQDVNNMNIQSEQKYICSIASENLKNIKDEIEKDIGKKVEIADTGSLDAIDIYFVVKEDNTYKYVVKTKEDEMEKYKVAQNNEEDARYIIPINNLGIDICVYTELKDYVIDKNGNITYTKM